MAQNKDFCQQFADNNFNIDHNIGRLLIIGSDYWTVCVTFHKNGTDFVPTYALKSKLSQRSDLFDKRYNDLTYHYIRAIDESGAESNEYILLIGRLYENTIQWIAVNESKSGIFKRDDFNGIENTEMDFEPHFKPTLGSRGCFIQQKQLNTNSNLFERKFRCFKFNRTEADVISYRNFTDDELRDSGFGLNYTNVNIIGEKIIAFESYGTVYYIENKTIIYCKKREGLFSKRCEETEVLINCSQSLKTTTHSTTTQSTTLSTNESTQQLSIYRPSRPPQQMSAKPVRGSDPNLIEVKSDDDIEGPKISVRTIKIHHNHHRSHHCKCKVNPKTD